MLEVKNVRCGYDNNEIIKGVSFNVEPGSNLCIVGPNGCGKSTLLKSIANLLNYKGSILLNGKEISKFNRKDLAKNIALMSQASSIYFPYTVYETVSLGRYAHLKGVFSRMSKSDEEIIIKSIENVGLLDLKDKLISELSGGQLQRVYLARAFAQDPNVILLDEPTNHLDIKYHSSLAGSRSLLPQVLPVVLFPPHQFHRYRNNYHIPFQSVSLTQSVSVPFHRHLSAFRPVLPAFLHRFSHLFHKF